MVNIDKNSIIRTDSLRKVYGDLVAVKDVNLEVLRGDVFGFLGPNGAGKTTTIRMLLGLIRPSSGNIHLFGMNQAEHLPEILPRIGALIETPVFYPYLSGLDNLRAFAAASGMRLGTINQGRLNEILELVDLSSRARDLYRKYSLGMKQRLGIAAALLTDPELLILDEPTNGLDPAGVHEVRQLIVHLAAAGKTLFLSSHILYEVEQVCNRVAILYKGNLLKQGYVADLLNTQNEILVRLNTLEEMQQAAQILHEAQVQGQTWITGTKVVTDKQKIPTIQVSASSSRSAEITAMLAQHGLYVAELRPYENSLEAFFLEVTVQASEAEEGLDALGKQSRVDQVSSARHRDS